MIDQSQLNTMKSLWSSILLVQLPSDQQMSLWLHFHGQDILEYAIKETAVKAMRLGNMTPLHSVRFCSSVCIAATNRKDLKKTEAA